MRLKVTDDSRVAYIDNKTGKVSVTGDPALVEQLELILVRRTQLTFNGQRRAVPEEIKKTSPEGCQSFDTDSDLYLMKYLPEHIMALGLDMEVEHEGQ